VLISQKTLEFLHKHTTCLAGFYSAVVIVICIIAVKCHQYFRNQKLGREIEAKRSMMLCMNNYYEFVINCVSEHKKTCFLMFWDKNKQQDPVFQSFQLFADMPRVQVVSMQAQHLPEFQWTALHEATASIFSFWLNEIKKTKQDRSYKHLINPMFKFEFQRLGDNMHRHLSLQHKLNKHHNDQQVALIAYDEVITIFQNVWNEIRAAETKSSEQARVQ
jgi:hypothetical protein